MLQDLPFGRLENEYRNCIPGQTDTVICINGGAILAQKTADGTLTFPRVNQVRAWEHLDGWDAWDQQSLRYVFRMQGEDYYLWMGQAGECPDGAFTWLPARGMRDLGAKEMCFAAMTAWHLYNWYRLNRFCGGCGAGTQHDDQERMLRCPVCGNMIFPRISPAVIVAVTDGDRLLLSKYAGRAFTRYALLAGYTEIGETLEQTVQREVMEEVGLRVKNIRYYKSQPWGVDGNVLMGFYCDLDGDDTICIDRRELSMAGWYPRGDLPARDDGISLTREMIRVFEEGREPKACQ